MALNAEDLIGKSKDQRSRKRYDEALISAQAATEVAPESADAWWQVALSRLSLGDTRNAIHALRTTVELAPWFAAGWAKLGRSFLDIGDAEKAKESFVIAIQEDSENLEALEAMSTIFSTEDKHDQDVEETAVLEQIEAHSSLDSYQTNRLGILHYRNKRLHQAIKYWRASAFESTNTASLFNLGLAYNHEQVSQDADAVDMWRLALRRSPGYESPIKSLTNTLPRMLNLAADARCYTETLLPREQWQENYLNPFALLNPPDGLDLYDLDPKTLQSLKKVLYQEIDLEDGNVSWMPGVTIDKSRAIDLCDELNNDAIREFHWHVYSNTPLLEFLTRGAHDHFLVGERESPLDTIELLEDRGSGFLEWLGDIFAPQYDRVLSKAVDSGNLVVLECLLDGRRWVPESKIHNCFENTRRMIDRMVQPIRDANANSADLKPSMQSLEALLSQSSLVSVLNLLPTYFEDFQNDAVHQIRGIAISCFNSHDDVDLSRKVIDLAKRFRFKSDHVNKQIEEDVEQIEKLIQQERKHEAKFTSGDICWEITKEGARIGQNIFIAAANISSIRYGLLMTGERSAPIYDFLLAVGDEKVSSALFTWRATKDLDSQQKIFNGLIEATIHYLLPSAVDRAEKRLANGLPFKVGPCKVTRVGVGFDVSGWFSTAEHFVPWPRVAISLENGSMTVQDSNERKKKVSFPFRDTENALVLRALANIKNGRDN